MSRAQKKCHISQFGNVNRLQASNPWSNISSTYLEMRRSYLPKMGDVPERAIIFHLKLIYHFFLWLFYIRIYLHCFWHLFHRIYFLISFIFHLHNSPKSSLSQNLQNGKLISGKFMMFFMHCARDLQLFLFKYHIVKKWKVFWTTRLVFTIRWLKWHSFH